MSIRQVGNVIRVAWTAPTRNTDDTTEKLELAEVEIRRRIVDVPALVEAQTEVIEPEDEEDGEGEEGEEPQEAGEGDLVEEETGVPETTVSLPAEIVSQLPAEVELPTEIELPEGIDPEDVLSEAEALLDELPEALPEAPSVPMLEIPGFAPESRYVTTFESTVAGEATYYEEELDPMWLGQRVEYAVVYINRSNRRGRRSTVVQIEPVMPLVTPGSPEAETGDGFVDVSWPGSGTEAEPSHYAIFRRAENAEDFPDRPLNPMPLDVPEFRDRGAPFDVRSCYVVRNVVAPPEPEPDPELDLDADADVDIEADIEAGGAADAAPEAVESEPEPEPEVATEPTEAEVEPEVETDAEPEPEGPVVIVPQVPPLKNETRIESQASDEVCLTPVDTFAIPAPTGLVAVASNRDVLLTWRDVERADATGYRVYRSESEGGPFAALNEELVRAPSFSDESVEAGKTYFYAVTVLDDARTPNESERSALSEVRFRP